VIISASRRTDIPAFYSGWFFNRIKEGFVLLRNPRRFRQIRRIELNPDAVDAFVFWTKNPAPMLKKLHSLKDYMYYFQFTITPYGRDVEPNVPAKNTDVISMFKEISEAVGTERIIWRYDPIFLNKKYTFDYHVHAFTEIAKALHRFTKKVTISFIVTDYRGPKSSKNVLCLDEFTNESKQELASKLAYVAKSYGLAIDACAEKMDLRELGIEPARCIDGRLLSKLLGSEPDVKKDKNQRPDCGCAASVDIGMYNTCMNGCLYCYANYNKWQVAKNYTEHNPHSPLLCGEESKAATPLQFTV